MTTPDKDTPLIFVVEEADIARLIASTLAEYGFRTETFGTGRALLSRARRAQPELAILDLGLPDMDGLQVLRDLQEQHPCAALILTGRDGLTDRVLGLELGADDYLVKPFEPRELVARVRSILRRYQKAATSDPPATPAPALPAGTSTSAASTSAPTTAAKSRSPPPKPPCCKPCSNAPTRSSPANSSSANATSTPSTAASTYASPACAANSKTTRRTQRSSRRCTGRGICCVPAWSGSELVMFASGL
jgi:CheY-like chemotaxis protein